ncbi:MAG: haloacid dehalogenase [Acidimicrobiaceae bacterium]|nr:haloacid dehalogenase [Acidimicrobiaceae bacterium]|tara:strand:- start:7566 stop:8282 length:717 start_codon:yes stop_codon:yes gene_type:complete
MLGHGSELPVLGLDADDTLWENEERFHEVEARFRDLVAPWADHATADAALLATERANIARHGYGIKGFVLSMVLTAIDLSNGTISAKDLGRIVSWGHEMMAHPIELLDGVARTLADLVTTHRLLVITKGDLGDQLSKVDRSGIANLFWQVEVVPEKDPDAYRRVLSRHDVEPAAFTMVGNSVKSDILPVLTIGGRAVHVPHTTTWVFEEPDPAEVAAVNFPVLESFSQLPDFLVGQAS